MCLSLGSALLTKKLFLDIIYKVNTQDVLNMGLKPKEMLRLLLNNGFIIVNQKGSHIKLKNLKTNKQTIVPMHSKELKVGLEKAILKQAGIKK